MKSSKDMLRKAVSAEIHKSSAWFNERFTKGDSAVGEAVAQELVLTFSALGLAEAALKQTWHLYVVEAMFSNELDVQDNLDLFPQFLLGLKKVWRNGKPIDASQAEYEGKRAVQFITERL